MSIPRASRRSKGRIKWKGPWYLHHSSHECVWTGSALLCKRLRRLFLQSYHLISTDINDYIQKGTAIHNEGYTTDNWNVECTFAGLAQFPARALIMVRENKVRNQLDNTLWFSLSETVHLGQSIPFYQIESAIDISCYRAWKIQVSESICSIWLALSDLSRTHNTEYLSIIFKKLYSWKKETKKKENSILHRHVSISKQTYNYP